GAAKHTRPRKLTQINDAAGDTHRDIGTSNRAGDDGPDPQLAQRACAVSFDMARGIARIHLPRALDLAGRRGRYRRRLRISRLDVAAHLRTSRPAALNRRLPPFRPRNVPSPGVSPSPAVSLPGASRVACPLHAHLA